MSNYERDIFYDIRKLTYEDKVDICNYAYDESFEWWVDKLDVSVSMARQRINMKFSEIMEMFDNSCFFVIIYRKGYNENPRYIEVGFSTMTGVSYYLWLHMKVDKLDHLINNYKLIELT